MAATPANRLLLHSPSPESTTAPRLYSTVRLLPAPRNKSGRGSFHCFCFTSMNGCGGGSEPVEICETRLLPPVTTAELALPQLRLAVSALNADPPASRSGIIRLEVPIQQRTAAINWLQEQNTLPCCFFSGRDRWLDSSTLLNNGGRYALEKDLISIGGVGSAVCFRRLDPFSIDDWKSIKRFLSKSYPYIRAYGAIRFDAGRSISSEWKEFGSFYFIVPQVEFNELEESSTLAANIAWDEALQWPWQKAMDGLQVTMCQICPFLSKLRKDFPQATVISSSHFPNPISWEVTVNKAMQLINGRSSDLVKVVLARSSRIVTDIGIDPITLLASLLGEGKNAYQFCIQPSDGPAFIGNTPEQLFHRKLLHVSSEALAGTRGRGVSKYEDLQIEQDLFLSPKDDIEFTIVRESIQRKLEFICNEVIVKPRKAIRKLPRVQHLSAQLMAKLRCEDDEFNILSSLHPTPAVCGLPTEESRKLIADTEIFDRGMYAGPVGWFGGNESEFAVGIRSALVEKGTGMFVYAGAGIVEGTNPTSEWEELELKVSQFTKLLQHGSLAFSGRK